MCVVLSEAVVDGQDRSVVMVQTLCNQLVGGNIQLRLVTRIVDGNTNGFTLGIQSKDGEMPGDDISDHGVTVLDPPATSCQSQVFVEWLIRVICVIQESVGIVNVISTNNAI